MRDTFQYIVQFCEANAIKHLLNTCKTVYAHRLHMQIPHQIRLTKSKCSTCFTNIASNLFDYLSLHHIVKLYLHRQDNTYIKIMPSSLKHLKLRYNDLKQNNFWAFMRFIERDVQHVLNLCSDELRSLTLYDFESENDLVKFTKLQKLSLFDGELASLPSSLICLKFKTKYHGSHAYVRVIKNSSIQSCICLKKLQIICCDHYDFSGLNNLEQLIITGDGINNLILPTSLTYLKVKSLQNNDHIWHCDHLKILKVEELTHTTRVPLYLQKLHICVQEIHFDIPKTLKHLLLNHRYDGIRLDLANHMQIHTLKVNHVNVLLNLPHSHVQVLHVKNVKENFTLPNKLVKFRVHTWHMGIIFVNRGLQSFCVDRLMQDNIVSYKNKQSWKCQMIKCS